MEEEQTFPRFRAWKGEQMVKVNFLRRRIKGGRLQVLVKEPAKKGFFFPLSDLNGLPQGYLAINRQLQKGVLARSH